MVNHSNSFLMESPVNRADKMGVKNDEREKECNQAAILIQMQFRKHSEERAVVATPDDVVLTDPFAALKASLAPASSIMGDSTTASIPLSFDDDDHRCMSEDCSSDEDEDQFENKDQFEAEYNNASKGDMSALTEPYYEGGKGIEEEKEEEKDPHPEQAPEKRSGKFLWGVAAGAVGLIGATMVVGMMSGGPIDEDDVVGVTGLVNSGGGGGAGGGAGGGGGTTGATTSAQMATTTQSMAASAAQSAASSVAAGTSASAAAASSTGIVGAITGASLGVQAAAIVTVTAVAVSIGIGVALSGGNDDHCSDVGSYKTYPGRLDVYFQYPLQALTLHEGGELTDLVIDRYNDLYGCGSDYSRLMLDTTTIRCEAGQDECCKLVSITDGGQRLLCEFDTLSTCAGCLSSEPLFADPEQEKSGGNGVGEWSSGVACFEMFLSRSNSQQICVDGDAPTFAPTTAYPTFSPSTSFPTLSPLTAIVFAGNLVAPVVPSVFN